MKLSKHNFFLFRTPMLPLNDLADFNKLVRSGENLPFDYLCTVFSTPLLQEALFIASPELYQEFKKYLHGAVKAARDKEKLAFTLLKYFIRACTRCTPYGLFAGCAVGLPQTNTAITLREPDHHRKYRRLDTNYVSELAMALLKIPLIAGNTKYYANSSLYAVADKYRYAEYSMKDAVRKYNLVAVDRSPYLDEVVRCAQTGVYKIEPVEVLKGMGIDEPEAVGFVDTLIAEQILVSELEPTVTGEDFLNVLIARLGEIAGAGPVVEPLKRMAHLLQLQNDSIEKYLEVKQILASLGVSSPGKDLIQTDLFLSAGPRQISGSVLDAIVSATEKVAGLSGMYASGDLDEFKRQFSERYEEQLIPLCLALDSEVGIGFGGHKDVLSSFTPLLDDIATGSDGSSGFRESMDAYKKWQAELYIESLRTGSTDVRISDADIRRFDRSGLPAFPGAYIFGSLFAKSAAALDAGDYLFQLKSFGGPSLANLLGRFCPGDPELASLTAEALRQSEADGQDVVYAEIVHLPQARLGNILSRPSLRNYEIVYLGNSVVDAGKRLDINDLYVGVRNGLVVLYSKKLGKKVIPRLTTAHNFWNNSLPVYRFLCDLQFQHTRTGYSWKWPALLSGQAHFPRVSYGSLILSRAYWNISLLDCGISKADLKNEDAVTAKLKARIGFLMAEMSMPKQVLVAEGDNELAIDLTLECNILLLRKVLLKRGGVSLFESFSTPDHCFITRDGKRFSNEIIIPVTVSAGAAPPAGAEVGDIGFKEVKRTFHPGSEWKYYKIYCGTNTAERVLREVVHPLVQQLQEEQLVVKWFFIRYADPDFHIRVRILHEQRPGFEEKIQQRIHALTAPFIQHQLIYKMQADTYKREVERYGPQTISLAEDVFCYDSELALALIAQFQHDESERDRWLWALRSIDAAFEAAGMGLPERLAAADKASENFVTEFGGSRRLKVQLSALYHREQKAVEAWLGCTGGAEDICRQYHARNERLKNCFRLLSIREPDQQGRFSVPRLLPSFIHMFINRLFHAKQRKYELVLYYFLTRFYKSKIARINQKQ